MEQTDYGCVLVGGASGATGRAVLRLLGPRPPTVRALTTSPDAGGELREAGADEVVIDDLLTPDDLDSALEVVSTPTFPDRGLTVDWQLPGAGGTD